MKMKRFMTHAFRTFLILLMFCFISASAENTMETAEQGLEEIRPLLDISDVEHTEGLSLEEMTDAFAESAMSEYLHSATGFSMQYPSVFLFDEGDGVSRATTSDGSATLSIENTVSNGALTTEMLSEAIRLEVPDAVIQKNEQNGCLRVDRTVNGGKTGKTDLYFQTGKSFHHIIIEYPAEEQGTYFSYIEYMINTMSTDETDLG